MRRDSLFFESTKSTKCKYAQNTIAVTRYLVHGAADCARLAKRSEVGEAHPHGSLNNVDQSWPSFVAGLNNRKSGSMEAFDDTMHVGMWMLF